MIQLPQQGGALPTIGIGIRLHLPPQHVESASRTSKHSWRELEPVSCRCADRHACEIHELRVRGPVLSLWDEVRNLSLSAFQQFICNNIVHVERVSLDPPDGIGRNQPNLKPLGCVCRRQRLAIRVEHPPGSPPLCGG